MKIKCCRFPKDMSMFYIIGIGYSTHKKCLCIGFLIWSIGIYFSKEEPK